MDPLSEWHHIGHEGGLNRNVRFNLHQIAPVFAGKDKDQNAQLTRCNALTFREIISDGKIQSEDRKLIWKPVFFFGDTIDGSNDTYLTVIANGSIRLATSVSSYPTQNAWSGYPTAVDVSSEIDKLGPGQVTEEGIYLKNYQSWCGSNQQWQRYSRIIFRPSEALIPQG